MAHNKGNMQITLNPSVIQQIKSLQTGSEKAVKSTVSDFKSRGPGWVASAVTAMYNIKKAEIIPAKEKKNKDKRMAGSIKASGDTIGTMSITYEGRLLTPVHFGMRPSTPPEGRSYTLKATIFKGKPTVIGRYKNKQIRPGGPFSEKSHNILMSTGAKDDKDGDEKKVKYIPFQRMSRSRKDIKKFTTVSVPQMITNEAVAEQINASINEGLGKRLEHHLKRFAGKKNSQK